MKFPTTPWTTGAAKILVKYGEGLISVILVGVVAITVAILLKADLWVKALWAGFLLTP